MDEGFTAGSYFSCLSRPRERALIRPSCGDSISDESTVDKDDRMQHTIGNSIVVEEVEILSPIIEGIDSHPS